MADAPELIPSDALATVCSFPRAAPRPPSQGGEDDDIADIAVAALTDDRHVGQLYELTGPRLLTFPEAIGEIARAAGREIRYVQVSPEQYASMLANQNVPAEFVSLMNYLFTEVLDGRNARLADGVQRALGRPPRDFAEYARETAATGIWGGVRQRQAHA